MKKTILALTTVLALGLLGTGAAQAHGGHGYGKDDHYATRDHRDRRYFSHDHRHYDRHRGRRDYYSRHGHRPFYGYEYGHHRGYQPHYHRYRPVIALSRHHHGYRYCGHHGGYFRAGDFYFGFRY